MHRCIYYIHVVLTREKKQAGVRSICSRSNITCGSGSIEQVKPQGACALTVLHAVAGAYGASEAIGKRAIAAAESNSSLLLLYPCSSHRGGTQLSCMDIVQLAGLVNCYYYQRELRVGS